MVAEINDYRGTKVGEYTVECVEMLDSDTCILSFETIDDEEDEDTVVDITAEYWIDEDSWHFNDTFFVKGSGDYLDTCKTTHLTEEEKDRCKEIIVKYLNQFTSK